MLNLKQLLGLAIAAGLMISAPASAQETIKLATTTSTENSVCWVTCCQNLNLNQAIRYK